MLKAMFWMVATLAGMFLVLAAAVVDNYILGMLCGASGGTMLFTAGMYIKDVHETLRRECEGTKA